MSLTKNDDCKGLLIQWWEETNTLFCISFSVDSRGQTSCSFFHEKVLLLSIQIPDASIPGISEYMFAVILRMIHKGVETST